MSEQFRGRWESFVNGTAKENDNIIMDREIPTNPTSTFFIRREPATTRLSHKIVGSNINFIESGPGANQVRIYSGRLIVDATVAGTRVGVITGRYVTLTGQFSPDNLILSVDLASLTTLDDSGDWTATRPPST